MADIFELMLTLDLRDELSEEELARRSGVLCPPGGQLSPCSRRRTARGTPSRMSAWLTFRAKTVGLAGPSRPPGARCACGALSGVLPGRGTGGRQRGSRPTSRPAPAAPAVAPPQPVRARGVLQQPLLRGHELPCRCAVTHRRGPRPERPPPRDHRGSAASLDVVVDEAVAALPGGVPGRAAPRIDRVELVLPCLGHRPGRRRDGATRRADFLVLPRPPRRGPGVLHPLSRLK